MLAAHLGAILLVTQLSVPWWMRGLLVGMGLASLLWQHRYGIARSTASLRIDADGLCMLSARDGAEGRHYRIVAATAFPLFVSLGLRPAAGRMRRLLLMRDAIEPAMNCELRARITQRRLPASLPQELP